MDECDFSNFDWQAAEEGQVRAFLADRTINTRGGRIGGERLFQEYRSWFKSQTSNPKRMEMTLTMFGMRMRVFAPKRKERVGIVYQGIALK